MNSECFTVQIPKEDIIRVDKFIASLGLFTRSQIARRGVRVSSCRGELMKMSRRLKSGEKVMVDWDDPESSEILAQAMDLNIIYEDNDCAVIDKEQGIVVHPAVGNLHGTLVQGLLHHYSRFEENFSGDRIRPGIVHRLDKDTSGLIIVAKTPAALEFLSSQFRERQVKKIYLAVTSGLPKPDYGEINLPIGRDRVNRKKFSVNARHSKNAVTQYMTLDQSSEHALLRVKILTGRTHQIRVHLKSIACSVLGDKIYGSSKDAAHASLMLHAWKLKLQLPSGERKNFVSKIPARFYDVARDLNFSLPN